MIGKILRSRPKLHLGRYLGRLRRDDRRFRDHFWLYGLRLCRFCDKTISWPQALKKRSKSVSQTGERHQQENLTLAGIRKGQVFLLMSDTGFEPVTSTV